MSSKKDKDAEIDKDDDDTSAAEMDEKEADDAADDDEDDDDEDDDDADDDDADDDDDAADDDADDDGAADDADDDEDDEDEDEDEDEDDEDDEVEAKAPAPAARTREADKKRPASSAKPSPRGRRPRPASSRSPKPADKGETVQSGPYIYAMIALLVGAAAGWFLRDARAGDVDADPDPAMASGSASPAGSASGPCDNWAATICKEAGEQSEACGQAKSASAILPHKACTSAMTDMPATLAKLKDARKSCDQLVDKLCGDLGKDTETCKMVKEKTPSFPAQRCQQMLGNYEQVLGELKKIEAQNAPLTPEVAAKQAAGEGPSFGPDDAKVVIVEYSDFECPFCSRAADVVKKLKKKYSKVVRFVFRQYPLPMHPNAPLAAEAALAAHAQGKFWAFHDLMFANQRALERESLEKYAKEVGLDVAKFKKALDDHTYAEAVKADQALGQEIGVSGTPTMLVGTERVQNPTDFDALSKQVDAQLSKAGVALPASAPAPDPEPAPAPAPAME